MTTCFLLCELIQERWPGESNCEKTPNPPSLNFLLSYFRKKGDIKHK